MSVSLWAGGGSCSLSLMNTKIAQNWVEVIKGIIFFLLFVDIADTLCYLLVGTSENGASQGIELVSRSPQELYEIVSLIG